MTARFHLQRNRHTDENRHPLTGLAEELVDALQRFEMPDLFQQARAARAPDDRLAVRNEFALEIGIHHRIRSFSFRVEHASFELPSVMEHNVHRTGPRRRINAFAFRVDARVDALHHRLHFRPVETLGQEL